MKVKASACVPMCAGVCQTKPLQCVVRAGRCPYPPHPINCHSVCACASMYVRVCVGEVCKLKLTTGHLEVSHMLDLCCSRDGG